jgi:hypothetical protein
MNPNAIIFAKDSKRNTPIVMKSNQLRVLAKNPFGSNLELLSAS